MDHPLAEDRARAGGEGVALQLEGFERRAVERPGWRVDAHRLLDDPVEVGQLR